MLKNREILGERSMMLTGKKRRLSQKKLVGRTLVGALVGLMCYAVITGPVLKLWRSFDALCRLECAQVTFASVYAPSVEAELTALIQHYVKRSHCLFFDAKHLQQLVKQACRLVCDVRCDRQKLLSVAVYVQGVEPAFVVNGVHVLAHDGVLYDRSLFALCDITHLKNITVDDRWCQAQNVKRVYDYAMRISLETWDSFEVVYHGPHTIEFNAKDEQGYLKTVMTDEHKVLNNDQIACIQDVVADVVQKKRIGQKQYHVACDTRFDKRIFVKILRRKNKGRRA